MERWIINPCRHDEPHAAEPMLKADYMFKELLSQRRIYVIRRVQYEIRYSDSLDQT